MYVFVYRYLPLQRVWFLSFFGLKTGVHFTGHFGLESGRVLEGTTEAYERIYRKFQMYKKEIEKCEFEMHFKNFFVCAVI